MSKCDPRGAHILLVGVHAAGDPVCECGALTVTKKLEIQPAVDL